MFLMSQSRPGSRRKVTSEGSVLAPRVLQPSWLRPDPAWTSISKVVLVGKVHVTCACPDIGVSTVREASPREPRLSFGTLMVMPASVKSVGQSPSGVKLSPPEGGVESPSPRHSKYSTVLSSSPSAAFWKTKAPSLQSKSTMSFPFSVFSSVSSSEETTRSQSPLASRPAPKTPFLVFSWFMQVSAETPDRTSSSIPSQTTCTEFFFFLKEKSPWRPWLVTACSRAAISSLEGHSPFALPKRSREPKSNLKRESKPSVSFFLPKSKPFPNPSKSKAGNLKSPLLSVSFFPPNKSNPLKSTRASEDPTRATETRIAREAIFQLM
mmetsp:Transcript_49634/g.97815  ORF Transcript_49634/g.97815 Transcript_49634/m.97815 type:complete len:323 (+) Transcript_49634:850-1818(+)